MTTTHEWQAMNKDYALPCGCRFEADIANTPPPADPTPGLLFCTMHAAAPDMLEALQEWMECAGFEDDPRRVQAADAIAKATEAR